MLRLSVLIGLVTHRRHMAFLLAYFVHALAHRMVSREVGRSGKGNDQMSRS